MFESARAIVGAHSVSMTAPFTIGFIGNERLKEKPKEYAGWC